MSITSAIVLFAVFWFMTLLVVLPIRLKTQGDVGEIVPGTHAGSPADPQLKKRALITTGIASVLWVIAYVVITSGWITVRDLDIRNVMGPQSVVGETDG